MRGCTPLRSRRCLDEAKMALSTGRVRMWRGGLRFSLLLPPLSFGGASIAEPSLRFHILLIEPDMQIW